MKNKSNDKESVPLNEKLNLETNLETNLNKNSEHIHGCSFQLDAHNCSLKSESQYSLSLIEASRDPLFVISP